MKCPIDNVDLVMSERHGIEIDYCPKCRGVWLDRGELDKIIERAVPEGQAASSGQRFAQERPASERTRPSEGDRYRENYREDDRYREQRPKRRESFLGDLFDF